VADGTRPADRTRSIGGLLGLGIAAAVVFVGWSASGAPRGTAAPDQVASADPAVLEAGRALYVANCASCHGTRGTGGPFGPTLQGTGAAGADFYLRTGRMPLSVPGERPVRHEPRFDEQEIQALVAYVASLAPGPDIPQVAAGGELHRGRELYTANCAACHAVTGAGNAIGGGYVAVGLGFADPRTVAEAVTIGPGAMPPFGFDAQDQADLAAYIAWLRSEPSPGGAPVAGTGPVAEGFIGIAIGVPLLLLVAGFVARHRLAEVPRPTVESAPTDDEAP
jgi:ubiquinol-cytochrome c reductase cytochrome c subunit